MTVCRRCQSHLVFWARTENDKPIMIDTEPDPRGNVVITKYVRGTPHVHVMSKLEKVAFPRSDRFYAHVVHCGRERPPLPHQPVEQLELNEPQRLIASALLPDA